MGPLLGDGLFNKWKFQVVNGWLNRKTCVSWRSGKRYGKRRKQINAAGQVNAAGGGWNMDFR